MRLKINVYDGRSLMEAKLIEHEWKSLKAANKQYIGMFNGVPIAGDVLQVDLEDIPGRGQMAMINGFMRRKVNLIVEVKHPAFEMDIMDQVYIERGKKK